MGAEGHTLMCLPEVRASATVASMDHEPHEPHEHMLYAEEVFRIQGAIFEVNRHMGSGFLEAVCQERLEIEPAARQIERLVL